ncbi:hypothetical protein HCY66_11580 [Acinetobacter radioresistens]|uniref:hypothetical protein n=1 Tax=Acinetobacter radioresistens TaxID=40216 RepID=UPI002002EC1C|nr:hypothetical protein [Acinetobacter radioresistens]MCK4090706.1 hypothetical protein [Acinetobacter radioresistens]
MKSKRIALIGLITFLAIILFLTAIFNWLWSGTGSDPTRSFYLPFTNDFSEFKDYATLYIALLSFGATMFAGLVVFLVFNDWKEQHNTTVMSEEAKSLLILVNDDLKIVSDIMAHLKNKPRHEKANIHLDDILYNSIQRISENVYLIGNSALILFELSNNAKLQRIRNDYGNQMVELHRRISEKINNGETIEDLITFIDLIKAGFLYDNKVYKKVVKSFIVLR